MYKLFLIPTLLLFFTLSSSQSKIYDKEHTFEIGKEHFLLDNTPFQIRCGEMHFARVPKEYWRHRIQMIKALGMNTICAYLFWNFHERTPGNFKWDGEADIAEFCKIAQEEGMWVILRPGPYACAEWEMGGLPWWLLKNDDIKLRTTDSLYITASQNYLNEVGRVLSKLQITNGGPIIMVQVENEYGFYGNNADYMGVMRSAVIDAGFNVPLFSCNPTSRLKNGFRPDLFPVVNFGANPEGGFKALREILPEGPLMCGEFYSGWFDTWGKPHSYGKIDQYLKDMEYMLKKGASFSVYMAHGGTTFGFWAGADRPFKPDVSSYDYGAPVSEAGWVTDKFIKTRSLISENLMPGESPLPEPPAPNLMTTFSSVELKQFAPLFKNLSDPIVTGKPKTMEYYNQARGSILYRTKLPAGEGCVLKVDVVHDFAWVFANGKKLGAMDRRKGDFAINIPARKKETTIDILVHAMGRINFGPEIHDRKGLIGSIQFLDDKSANIKIGNWNVFNMSYDDSMLNDLKFEEPNPNENMPGIWSGEIMIDKVGDVFLDVSSWGKGVVWINGHCLGRYWNIGPTQTMYIPGPWLKRGVNKVLVLDLLGPEKPILRGLDKPILNDLNPEKDFSYSKRPSVELNIKKIKPNHKGQFLPGGNMQTVKFLETTSGRYFCFEALSSFDKKPFAAIAEIDILDSENNPLSHQNWKIAYVSSEELEKENGSAENAIDGQTFNHWHSSWSNYKSNYPHYLVIDLGKDENISGFRYVPRADNNSPGRIKDYQVFIGNDIIKNKVK
ncbi:beta-galactosidase [Flavisericum labens]|uniref:beta-galactosidase n=1 Tax=Flavisericum labens TaxID=3377112 RepID=UPI00387AF1F3